MIVDYSSLQEAISRWLHRSDLAGIVPDLIILAETRFNRNIRVRQMQVRSTNTVATQSVALPSDWLELIGEPAIDGEPLSFVSRDQMLRTQCGYTIDGSDLVIGPKLDAPVELSFAYYQKIPALSDNNSKNWLLDDGPDIYLYGSLLEAAPYIKDDPRIETWRGLLQVGLTDLQRSSDIAKYSGGTLSIGGA